MVLLFSSFVFLPPRDSIPPTIRVISPIEICVGEGISLRRHITVFDDLTDSDNIKIKADLSNVDVNTEGEYPVYISATDACGNTSKISISITVKYRLITREILDLKIQDTARSLMSEDMTDEEKCRAIYKYVRENIEYSEAYQQLDRITSAYHGLQYLRGDCYVSYSVCAELLDYCGIDNVPVKRKEGHTQDTHFWCLVSLNGEWYHLDATRLYPDMENMGCLMTDEQLDKYNKYRAEYTGRSEDNYFYCYDKDKLPQVSNTVITQVREYVYKKHTAIS